MKTAKRIVRVVSAFFGALFLGAGPLYAALEAWDEAERVES